MALRKKFGRHIWNSRTFYALMAQHILNRRPRN